MPAHVMREYMPSVVYSRESPHNETVDVKNVAAIEFTIETVSEDARVIVSGSELEISLDERILNVQLADQSVSLEIDEGDHVRILIADAMLRVAKDVLESREATLAETPTWKLKLIDEEKIFVGSGVADLVFWDSNIAIQNRHVFPSQ